jgi:hypothetical protein
MDNIDNESGVVAFDTNESRIYVRRNAFHFAMRIEEKKNRPTLELSDILSTATLIEKWMTGSAEYPAELRTNPL